MSHTNLCISSLLSFSYACITVIAGHRFPSLGIAIIYGDLRLIRSKGIFERWHTKTACQHPCHQTESGVVAVMGPPFRASHGCSTALHRKAGSFVTWCPVVALSPPVRSCQRVSLLPSWGKSALLPRMLGIFGETGM